MARVAKVQGNAPAGIQLYPFRLSRCVRCFDTRCNQAATTTTIRDQHDEHNQHAQAIYGLELRRQPDLHAKFVGTAWTCVALGTSW